MQNLIDSLSTQSETWLLIIVMLISFFESLALIGLVLPGAILMASFGTMIGSGKLNIYLAWISGTTGCLLGDWLSYFLGKKFKNPLNNSAFLKKYKIILDKIRYSLYKYSVFTVLFGKFIGHIRPLVPLFSGMIDLPVKKFFFPNAISCFIWPILYFVPGIITGAIIDIPKDQYGFLIKFLLFIVILMIFIGIWLCYRWKNYYKKEDWLVKLIPISKIKWIAPFFLILGLIGFIALQFHPIMILLRYSLLKVFLIN